MGIENTSTSGLAVMQGGNCKCLECGDIFGEITQVTRHIVHKHRGMGIRWEHTDEPITRTKSDWRARLAARAANKDLVGPFKCNYCDFITTKSVGGIGAHIGHKHKTTKGPYLAGTHFEALGTGTASPPRKKNRRGPYKKRQTKSIGSQVKQALTSGKPAITLEIPLSDDITICVPLVLGPPVFIERNSDG